MKRLTRSIIIGFILLSILGVAADAVPERSREPSSHETWTKILLDPPMEYTLIPFWFWNDVLTEDEIVRQIDDFAAHGIYGFLIHPRIGLPEDIGFMSDRFLHFVRAATEHAARRGLIVHLYDEGMYPSGSACGLVVKENPAFAARCIIPREIESGAEVHLEEGEKLVTVQKLPDGKTIAVIDAPSRGKIRGIHFGQDDGEPSQPPAGDLLNPESTACFIRHVHEKFYEALKPDLRYRHIAHPGRDSYFLFNEGEARLTGKLRLSAGGSRYHRCRLEAGTLAAAEPPITIDLPPHATEVIIIDSGD